MLQQAPVLVPNPNIATFRASNVLVSLDGGAFIIAFYDDRQQKPATGGTEWNQENRAWNEVVKLSLSPVALGHLRAQIDNAVSVYETAIGHLMSPSEYVESLKSAVQDKVVDRAEQLLKPPEPPEEPR
ncbi:MAG TPA: hypothetical protein VFB22_00805 [Candidatus Baltobacteraceae bacterium]|nr:hypothetical protein [Candidatus Baltobacteraceae bacterium]